MCRAKIHLKYLRSVQYTDNDEVLTKMYRSQMNLTENIKSEAFFKPISCIEKMFQFIFQTWN